ncbi:WxL domain-containing protein [Carnobacterium gallinarum]|uniref:WxL domain-containing protein n=1 Tax=Carnobacterium gallinarum TaxID=2749 RepID=UPI00054F9071|nr:WxL domain-containing protein [Carnobacterium gallinarum]
MKMTKLAAVALVTGAGFTLLAPLACADEAGQASKVTSSGVVTFESTPTDPNGNTGPLRIQSVSSIDFGSVGIKGDTMTYPARYSATEKEDHLGSDGAVISTDYLPLNITTVDDRGSNAGWQLQVTQSRQFTELDASGALKPGGLELNGASIKLSADNAVRPEDKKTEPAVTVPTSFSTNVVVNNKMQPLVKANVGEGMGTWNSRMGSVVADATDAKNPNVELTIPGGIQIVEASYQAELTWLLIDSPDLTPAS